MGTVGYLIFVLVVIILPIATFVGTIYVVAYFRNINIDPNELDLTIFLRLFAKLKNIV